MLVETLAGDGGVRADHQGGSCWSNERCNHFCLREILSGSPISGLQQLRRTLELFISLLFIIHHLTLPFAGIGVRLSHTFIPQNSRTGKSDTSHIECHCILLCEIHFSGIGLLQRRGHQRAWRELIGRHKLCVQTTWSRFCGRYQNANITCT